LCAAFSVSCQAGQDSVRAQETAGSSTQTAADLTIAGRIVDPTGVGVAGAAVKLTGSDPAASQQTVSDNDGRFAFAHLRAGPIHLAITADGFAARQFDGYLEPARTT
jgi:hypothetical protein